MQHYSSQAFTDIGKPAGGATITVKMAGTNNNATVYSDDGITVKSNPFVANTLGQFDFYAASGKYDITVTGTQITTYTLPNQVIFDPFEQTNADTSLAAKSLTVNPLISSSANPAATGFVRAAAGDILKFRNNANSADIIGIQKNASDVVQIGDTAGAASVGSFTVPTGQLMVANGGLTVATGQIISADQVLPINASGVGGFWGFFFHPPDVADVSYSALMANGNEVRVIQFILPFKFQIGKVSYRVSTGSAGSTGDIGIYDTNGNKLANTGGFSTAGNGIATAAILPGPVTLNAGYYYLAWTNSSAVPQFFLVSIVSDVANVMNNGGSKIWAKAANNASAGILPSTLGALTTDATYINVPCVYFER